MTKPTPKPETPETVLTRKTIQIRNRLARENGISVSSIRKLSETVLNRHQLAWLMHGERVSLRQIAAALGYNSPDSVQNAVRIYEETRK